MYVRFEEGENRLLCFSLPEKFTSFSNYNLTPDSTLSTGYIYSVGYIKYDGNMYRTDLHEKPYLLIEKEHIDKKEVNKRKASGVKL